MPVHNIGNFVAAVLSLLVNNSFVILNGFVIFVILTSFNNHNFNKNRTSIDIRYPAIVEWTTLFALQSRIKICPDHKICQIVNYYDRHKHANIRAYTFFAPHIDFNHLPLPRKPQNILWALFQTESPLSRKLLQNENVLKLFNYSATFSRNSDIPFTSSQAKSLYAITSKQYFVPTSEKNLLLRDISPILYFQTNRVTSTDRDVYVEKLMKYIPIDSYGDCLNNKQIPKKFKHDYAKRLYGEEILKFIARYKFMIAIENAVCDDYITEKLWRPIHVGVVPIYFGSPTVRDWLPNNKSAILIKDYPTPKIMAEHIKKIMSDDEMYEEYLEHKTKGIITNERLKYELTIREYQKYNDAIFSDLLCLICKKLYDLKDKTEVRFVNKTHYNCPKPTSAVTLGVFIPKDNTDICRFRRRV